MKDPGAFIDSTAKYYLFFNCNVLRELLNLMIRIVCAFATKDGFKR